MYTKDPEVKSSLIKIPFSSDTFTSMLLKRKSLFQNNKNIDTNVYRQGCSFFLRNLNLYLFMLQQKTKICGFCE